MGIVPDPVGMQISLAGKRLGCINLPFTDEF
jgi:hypothetical protein